MTVIWAWQGAVTDIGFRVVTKVSDGADVRLAVADNEALTSPTFFGPVTPTAQNVASVTATGLDPDTRWWWAVEHDSVLDTGSTGTLLTDPIPGTPVSYVVGAAGDAGLTPEFPGTGTVLAADRLSNHPIFDTIRERAVAENWRRFLHLGDLHYYDLGSGQHGIAGGASLANYRRSYDDVLAQPRQHDLYRSVGVDYIWDDHDYGPNDSDGTHSGKAAGQQAYRELVPHYPLPGTGTTGLALTASGADTASTPDTAELDIAQQLDVRIDARLDDWTPAAIAYLVAKYATTGNQRSYALRLNAGGNLALAISSDGTAFDLADSGVTVPAADGQRISLRVTVSVDPVTGDWEVKFYTGPTIDGPWTQIGATPTGTLPGTALFNGTAPLVIGANGDGNNPCGPGTVYAAKVLQGVEEGQERANPDFTVQTPSAPSFVDDAGRTWTINGVAEIVEEGPGPLYHSFELGRVLWVVADTRSDRSPNDAPDNAAKTMLGPDQKAWLANLLTTTDAEVLVWVMPSQWTTSTVDSWASFQTERAELVELFTDLGWIDRMCGAGADSHSLYIITEHFTRTIEPFLSSHFPHYHFASLDSTPSAGPQTDTGPNSPGRGQYGTIEVQDFGTHIIITGTGYIGLDEWRSYAFAVNTPIASTIVVDPRIARTVAGSHTPVFEARVLSTFQTGVDPEGEEIAIVDGAVAMDGTADIQRSLDLTTVGRNLFPRRLGDLLLPDGTEVFVRRGLDLGDGIIWAPLGYFRIQTTGQPDAPDGEIRLVGYDRMKGLIDSPLLSPVAFDADRTFGQVFDELVFGVYPEAVIQWDDGTEVEQIGRLLVVERSRYEPLRTLAQGRGKILHWDGGGTLQVRTAPDPATPVWEAKAGRDGVLTRASRAITRDDVVNAVVVRSQGGDDQAPARAVAIDDGPHSITRFGGRFGVVPEFITVPATTSVLQASAAARDILLRRGGLPHQVEFQAVPNPALQPYDPIRVTLRNGDRERHVLERLTLPLTARAGMTGGTREVRHVRVVVTTL